MANADKLPANVQRKNMLYDFYGSLLTDKQSSFFTMHYMDDLSLAEIGEHCGVTPQAVADLLKRANNSLESYETRLGLLKKLTEQKETMRSIQAQTDFITRVARENGLPVLLSAAVQTCELAAEMML